MNDSERPPLGRRVLESIEIVQHALDEQEWPEIASLQVSPKHVARPLLPPKTPMLLLSRIQNYAAKLFLREADQYEQFRKNQNYAPWLGKLEERVIARVLRTIAAIEQANKPATLTYHELSDEEIMQGLGQTLFEIRSRYVWREIGPNVAPPIPPAGSDAAEAKLSTGEQIIQLLAECGMTHDQMAEALDIDVRQIYRHCAGETTPRQSNVVGYQRVFSEKLGRSVRIKTSAKRHANVSKRQ